MASLPTGVALHARRVVDAVSRLCTDVLTMWSTRFLHALAVLCHCASRQQRRMPDSVNRTLFFAGGNKCACRYGSPGTRLRASPIDRRVILQELPPHMLAGVESVDDRVDDARGAVDDVQRQIKTFLLHLEYDNFCRIFIDDPANVHTVHIDTIILIISRQDARHHVQYGLGHVGVRVAHGLEITVELTFHRRDVDDMLVALGRAQHQRFEPRIDNKRNNNINQLHFQQLHQQHFSHQQTPRIATTQIDLLQVLIQTSIKKQILLAHQFIIQQRNLQKLRNTNKTINTIQTTSVHHQQYNGRNITQQLQNTQTFVMTHKITHDLE